jgi:hypothetical protein
MHHAVRVCDVLRCIFVHLEGDSRTLHAAVMVCRVWAAEATAILWRHPTAIALISLSAERRQHLASLARSVTLDAEISDLEAAVLEATELPRLKQLRLRKGLAAPDVFKGRCPSLQDRAVSRWQCGWNDNSLPELLHNFACGVVRGPHCVYLDRPFVFDVLVRLAILDCAQTLHLGPQWLSPAAVEALTLLKSPFARLRTLYASAWALALPLLAPLLPSVRHLRLKLTGSNTTGLPALAVAMRNLVTLKLCYIRFVEFVSAQQIVALGRLAALEALELDSSGGGPRTCTDMTDADMDELVAGLPRLRHLLFHLYARMTDRALVAIGQRCRQLENLWLDGTFALHELTLPSPALAPELEPEPTGGSCRVGEVPALFPNLRLLCITSIKTGPQGDIDDGGKTAARVVRVLARQAPQLETFRLQRGSKTDEVVIDQWRKSRAKGGSCVTELSHTEMV